LSKRPDLFSPLQEETSNHRYTAVSDVFIHGVLEDGKIWPPARAGKEEHIFRDLEAWSQMRYSGRCVPERMS
jgi:hypothetical protein